MKYLLKKNLFEKILKKVKKCDSVFLFLDYDGTLTPIVNKPELAYLSDNIRLLLRKITNNKKFVLSIVSGRALQDLKKKINLNNVCYVSNHGLIISYKKYRWKYPVAKKYKLALLRCYNEIKKEFKSSTGIKFEFKNITFAIHYRSANERSLKNFKKKIKYCLRNSDNLLKIQPGKKMYEIKPNVNWNKGLAVLKILSLFNRKVGLNNIIFYLGDDKTDEYAFRMLTKNSYTIHIGGYSSSTAKYFLKNTKQVEMFLMKIYNSIN